MSQQSSEKKSASSRRSRADHEEERVWAGFYHRIGDPAIATELIEHLDQDPALKTRYPALYLKCRQSVRRHRERQARAKRIGKGVRAILHALLVMPLRAVSGLCRGIGAVLRFGGDVAIASLPDTGAEPGDGLAGKRPSKGAAPATKVVLDKTRRDPPAKRETSA